MKFVRILFAILSIGFVLSACQKDFSYESGAGHGTLAKDAFGDCASILVNGSYQKDTLLRGSNFIEVQANFTQLGNYSIKTDTVNGYSFSAVGYTGVVGLNTIRLVGVGKPLVAGVDVFTVKFDTSSCKVNVNVTIGAGGVLPAVFTLNGNPTACAAATLAGNYNMSLPTTSTGNTVTITANVTTAGSYTITTPLVNGVSFTGTGTLTIGASQPIILRANGGTPAAAGTFNYLITGSAGNCNFDVVYGAALAPAVYTFTCAGATVLGTYEVGTAMTASNTITLPITVATGGTYIITTTVNGITFSGSGVLPATPAAQSIILTASGSPLAVAAPSTFVISGGGGANCSVNITVTAAVVPGTITAFVNGGGTVTTFNIGATGLLTSFGGISTIDISGDNSNATNTASILLGVTKTGSITTGTYTQSNLVNTADGQYDNTTGTSFYANLVGGTLTLNVTSITTVAPLRIQGTFSGTFKDAFGTGTNTTTFATGTFDVPYN
ncbi:MAG: hypothetical protein ABL929_05785 [Ferruginibacter sp.]|nr:hypothetical protein [Ferruginibacter sp.]